MLYVFIYNFFKKKKGRGVLLGAEKAVVVAQWCDGGSQNRPQRPWAFIWCSSRVLMGGLM